MADKNIGDPALLTKELATTDRITITREATGQTIATMTVEDFLAWMTTRIKPVHGDDTVEHLIPGEFVVDAEGVKKQVYGRRCTGTIGATTNWYKTAMPFGTAPNTVPVAVEGCVGEGQWSTLSLLPNRWANVSAVGNYGVCLVHDGSLVGQPYNVYLKYVYP